MTPKPPSPPSRRRIMSELCQLAHPRTGESADLDGATGRKREGARRSVEEELKLLGLSGPALTSPSPELRPIARTPTTGLRRSKGNQGRSGYDVEAPWVWRAKQAGRIDDLLARLKEVRRVVRAGGEIFPCVADGTLWGWRVRTALSSLVGEAIDEWDKRRGRTHLERLAVLDRALGELGVEHRGGWSISSGRGVE